MNFSLGRVFSKQEEAKLNMLRNNNKLNINNKKNNVAPSPAPVPVPAPAPAPAPVISNKKSSGLSKLLKNMSNNNRK
jgi:hypothetical protein